tara:strand:+ start:616 stop:1044 length:429 start_codon:yes stop_codon:yes gene_type:complete
MGNLAVFNKVTSSANSTTNILYMVNLSKISSTLTAATTAAFTWYDDGGAANTMTFTVTGGTPASADDFIISNDAAGEKMKNVKRICDWMHNMISDSVNGSSKHNKVWGGKSLTGMDQAYITTSAGLTFGGATTEPLVSINVA